MKSLVLLERSQTLAHLQQSTFDALERDSNGIHILFESESK